jgi:hypothetical protein
VADESKTILYGYSGDLPWFFTLDEGEESDFGYLKLFVSDCYLDLLHLQRSMVFKQLEEPEDRHFNRPKTRVYKPSEQEMEPRKYPAAPGRKLMQTMVIPVFQKKPFSLPKEAAV